MSERRYNRFTWKVAPPYGPLVLDVENDVVGRTGLDPEWMELDALWHSFVCAPTIHLPLLQIVQLLAGMAVDVPLGVSSRANYAQGPPGKTLLELRAYLRAHTPTEWLLHLRPPPIIGNEVTLRGTSTQRSFEASNPDVEEKRKQIEFFFARRAEKAPGCTCDVWTPGVQHRDWCDINKYVQWNPGKPIKWDV